jgi:hypothetical protein
MVSAALQQPPSLRRGQSTKEEKMPVIFNPRGPRAAWDEGSFDAIVMAAHAMGGGERLSRADATALTVGALKFWPHNSVVGMVDRVMLVDETIASGGRGTALALLMERDFDAQLIHTLWRPVLFASTLRDFNDGETRRLVEAVRAAGVDPAKYGLPV